MTIVKPFIIPLGSNWRLSPYSQRFGRYLEVYWVIQWNLYKADTIGAKKTVSALYRFF